MDHARTRPRWIAGTLLVAVLALAACGGAPAASPTAAPAAQPTAAPAAQPTAAPAAGGAGERIPIAFVAGIVGIPFYTSMECGARAAAEDLNVDLSWQGPPQWDLALQQPMLDAALQQDPAGMVIAPTDPNALVSWVEGVMGRGIPVVTVDGNLAQKAEYQNIRSNNIEAGAAAAKAMAEAIGGEGQVFVVALKRGVTANDQRVDGFVNELKASFPNIEVLPVAYPGTDVTAAAEQTSAAIQGNPDLKGIYTTHSSAAQGASSAVLAANKKGVIKVVAYDADPQQVKDLKDGLYDALVVQTPYYQGYESVKLVAEIARKQVDPASLTYERSSPVVIATRDNIDSPEVSQYLYVSECR